MKSFIRKIVIVILWAEAKCVIRKYKPKIIAITGSVGKTSTKDVIFTVVGDTIIARKNIKSFNSEIGIPLTILNCENGWSNIFSWVKNFIKGLVLIIIPAHYPKWLILEVGADKPGSIAKVVSWIIPDITVITRIGDVPVHVEFYKSPEEVYVEKATLAKALRPSGILILNGDEDRVLRIRDGIKCRSITYGMKEESIFRGTNVAIFYEGKNPVGTSFNLEYGGNIFPIIIRGVLGNQSVYSALAALATGSYLKLNIVDMINKLSTHINPPGRMRIIPGIKGAIIIDDTYNSSPVAAEAAIHTLKSIKTKGKRIAVLGDMLELGKFTIDEHKKLGILAGEFVDHLITVGPRSKYIVEGALDAGMSEKNILEYNDSRSAGKYLEGIIHPGDIILVKGSQGIRMERTVEEIMANPEECASLLVRQEEEWENRH